MLDMAHDVGAHPGDWPARLALLRAAGSDLLRGREAQERLGVTTLGDAMRLGLVLKTLGVMWDGA